MYTVICKQEPRRKDRAMNKQAYTELNENEKRALNAIIETCDDLDGELFTRVTDAGTAVLEEFDYNGHVAGGYITDLINKGFIEIEEDDFYGDGMWVNI